MHFHTFSITNRSGEKIKRKKKLFISPSVSLFATQNEEREKIKKLFRNLVKEKK
jgi:hypothetical protein